MVVPPVSIAYVAKVDSPVPPPTTPNVPKLGETPPPPEINAWPAVPLTEDNTLELLVTTAPAADDPSLIPPLPA